jgi:GNAT superfamily N-acetyltransferase
MPLAKSIAEPLVCRPVTPDRWEHLEVLFGVRGACAGCWCMWWRQTRAEHEQSKGEPNRQALRQIVLAGEVPGILAYAGDRPVGWCAIAPREAFPRLERSRTLKRVDDAPVWSITCLFVERQYRKQGVSTRLVQAAINHARANGATIVEAYPVEPRGPNIPPVFAWTGVASTFRQLGFTEVARRSATRPIMRIEVGERSA